MTDLQAYLDAHTATIARLVDDLAALRLELRGTPAPCEYMSIRDAARYMGVSERSVRHLLATERLTRCRPTGRRVMIKRSQIDAIMKGDE